MKKTYIFPFMIGLFAILSSLMLVSPAGASTVGQGESSLVLRLSRDFGYSSGSGQMQGTFTMHVSGPANLARVDFMIDGKQIGEVTQAPFDLKFVTDTYGLGNHTLSAVGFTSDGQELQTPNVNAEFVSSQEGMRAAGRILIPILVIVLLAVVVSALFPLITGRGKLSHLPPGTPRNYGLRGGGICPKCGRPFAFSFLAPNLPFFKIDRCPFCGHWGPVRVASLDALRKAEAAELENAGSAQQVPEESEAEKLRKELDESRYQGG